MPLTKDPTSPSGYRYADDSMRDYPALDRTPSGNPVKRTNDADLMPRQTLHDTAYDVVEQHGNMTVVKDGSPPLPLHGQTEASLTTSSVAEQTKRRLDADIRLREAIYEDGQTPESFDLTRGPHSGRGADEPQTSADDLRDALLRADGASDFDIAMLRVMGR